MTSNMGAAFILVLALAFAIACGDVASAQTGDYMHDLQALEYRISKLEKALNEVSTLVTKEARDTLGFFQETGKVMRESSLRMDSLKRRMSELERKHVDVEELKSRVNRLEAKILELEGRELVAEEGIPRLEGEQADVEELKSRVNRLEAKVLELERGGMVSKSGKAGTTPLAKGSSEGRRPVKSIGNRRIPSRVKYDYEQPRPKETIRIPPFEARSAEVRTEIHYHTARHNHQRKPDRQAISATLGFLAWWIAVFWVNSYR